MSHERHIYDLLPHALTWTCLGLIVAGAAVLIGQAIIAIVTGSFYGQRVFWPAAIMAIIPGLVLIAAAIAVTVPWFGIGLLVLIGGAAGVGLMLRRRHAGDAT